MTDTDWLAWARGELGVRETPGPVSTKRILDYRAIAGIHLGGEDGVVPWCAIFVNAGSCESMPSICTGLIRPIRVLPCSV